MEERRGLPFMPLCWLRLECQPPGQDWSNLIALMSSSRLLPVQSREEKRSDPPNVQTGDAARLAQILYSGSQLARETDPVSDDNSAPTPFRNTLPRLRPPAITSRVGNACDASGPQVSRNGRKERRIIVSLLTSRRAHIRGAITSVRRLDLDRSGLQAPVHGQFI